MKFVISHEAPRDLDQVWLYSNEKWSKEQADNYLNLHEIVTFVLDEFVNSSN
jgi:plasmid stabilization system protein ParE